ncbi:MAG: excinuclease ABC subunit UvrC [Clostridia bacterium]|nr:excinuclease ABC subunit UvrC [Clostridia bacterium]
MTREELYGAARSLPATPGVYIMRNSADRVIYVGKSKALRNRVSSYFAPYANHVGKTLHMVNSVVRFEVYHTATELEALVLENQFIKQYMPRYNIKLKDSSGYPYIRVSDDEYPRISVVNKREGGGVYYGPYASHGTAKGIVASVKGAFALPSCTKRFPADIGKGRPCLNYHIGRCGGLCGGKMTKADYMDRIAGAKRLLGGDCTALIKDLEEQMNRAAENMEYERAAAYRDSMRAVAKIKDKQHVVAAPEVEADVFGLYSDDGGSAATVLIIRSGAIRDREVFFFGADELISPSSMASFISGYYKLRGFVPRELWLGYDLGEETELLGEALPKCRILIPKRGEKKAVADMACNNAKEQLLHKRAENEKQTGFLASFAAFLGLEVLPERIESYDISNSGDEHITAGMVVLEKGRFCKRHYKTFNIKESEAQDDVGATMEALRRRFAHVDEDDSWACPDLILADGGVGQINAIRAVLEEYGLSVPVFGMVKDEHHKTRTLTDGENELSLNKRQDIFVFIYKLQEEVHRFALARMDRRRRNTARNSILTKVKGVGSKKAEELLRAFGGLGALKNASVEEIAAVKGINEDTARLIKAFLEKSFDKDD